MSYHKWLGAGLGWAMSGSPLGAIVGFGAGKMLFNSTEEKKITSDASDFEVNLLLLTAHLIKTEKGVTFSELNFVRSFLTDQIKSTNIEEKMNVLNHFLQKDYDTQKACQDIFAACPTPMIHQIMWYLFDLADADKPVSEKERNAIFILGGWMNVNAKTFLEIENARNPVPETVFDLLGVNESDNIEVIRTAYRKMMLKYHPDKHPQASAIEKKNLEVKIALIKEAYEQIKKLKN